MKRARAFVKKHVQRVKSIFKSEQPLASAAHGTSIAANLITDRRSRNEPAVSSVGTSTAGNISHQQRTRVQSADSTATAKAPVQPRMNTKTINSDTANGHGANAGDTSERLPVNFSTVGTHNLDGRAAELSGSSSDPTAALGQSTTGHTAASVNGTPVIAQAVAPVAGPVTASNAPLSGLAGPVKSPHVQPRFVQQSSSAMIWHEALKTLQKNDPEKYKVLDKVLENVSTPKNDEVSKLYELSESKPESKALLLRAKAILPSLSTTRVVAMTIANMDPHKIAPYVVAGTFFIIDVLLGRLTLEDRRKIRNMLFESVNAINEWISFETNFLKRNDGVEQDVQELEALLPNLYNLALQLLCNLLTASNASWLKTVGDKLSAALVKWQEQVEELKDHRAKWAAKRKVMEEKLSSLEHITKVLAWIKSSDDPEQSLKALSDRTTSEGRQKDSASWILDNQTFKAWSQNFYPFEPSLSTASDIVSNRVLWVSGSYGVGKTTIVYRIVSELQRLADDYLPSGVIQEESSEAKGLQVISYFCDTTKRVNYETIIRSIGQKLSLLPDFTIAQKAQEFYNKKTLGLTSKIHIKEYEDLVHSLLNERSELYNVALLIDGLNECDPPQDAEALCAFIRDIVIKNPQLRVLFSSHEKLSGSEKLKEHIEQVKVVATAPGNELENFVKTEIKFRQAELKDSESIFLNPEYKSFLDELQQSLFDRAKGMYIWVQVWLNITLPLQNNLRTVRLEEDARELLDALHDSSTGASEANQQLQAGYERLWDLGALRKFEEIRKRLFRFVICAFAPLDLSTVAHALRIGIEDSEPLYRKEIPIKDVDKLCSNFLLQDDSDHLRWTHDSARDFVVRVILNPGIDLAESSAKETSMKSNHLLIANTFIAVMRASDHPVWRELDLDPSQWGLGRRIYYETELEDSLGPLIRNEKSSLGYLCRYGWHHCEYAADKNVIFDPLWTRVLRELILHHKTTFGLWWQVWFLGLDFENCIRKEILGDYAGERVILISHFLAFLNLEADRVSDVQFEKAAKAPREQNAEADLLESLVQHAACKSLNGANVLHVACKAKNGSILNLMLQAILHRHGGVAHLVELLEEEYQSRTPFVWAWISEHSLGMWKRLWIPNLSLALRERQSKKGISSVETLLRFENDHLRPNGCDQSGNRALSLCLWSHKRSEGDRILLIEAVSFDEEYDVISLLDIHKPCNIDIQDEYTKETALHFAVRRGSFQLVKVLIEGCHATVEMPNYMGKTPLDVARDKLRDGHSIGTFTMIHKRKPEYARVIEYLESLNQSDETETATRIR